MAKDEDAPKYGVAELANELGIEQATARVGLRALQKKKIVTKEGKRWGWDTKSDFNAVVKAMKARATDDSKGPAKGSPEAKEKMAKLRAARDAKKDEPETKPKRSRKKKVEAEAE